VTATRKSLWTLPGVISLMGTAFTTLSADAQDGQWNHRVSLATSGDGLMWTVPPETLAERASVPGLFLSPDDRPTIP
jgi:hypothetical protein